MQCGKIKSCFPSHQTVVFLHSKGAGPRQVAKGFNGFWRAPADVEAISRRDAIRFTDRRTHATSILHNDLVAASRPHPSRHSAIIIPNTQLMHNVSTPRSPCAAFSHRRYHHCGLLWTTRHGNAGGLLPSTCSHYGTRRPGTTTIWCGATFATRSYPGLRRRQPRWLWRGREERAG